MSRFAMGFTGGAVIALVAVLWGAARILPPAVAEATWGWNLVTVTVASRDLPAGTMLDWKDVRQRDLPEYFVTDAHVLPNDLALILRRPTPRALKAGELLVYATFAPPLEHAPDGCE